MKSKATVVWANSGNIGFGPVSSQSEALERVYNAYNILDSEDEEKSTEELIAASHAACFTFKLCSLLDQSGFKPEFIETTAEVIYDKNSNLHSHLKVMATIPGISAHKFLERANHAKVNCLVSKALGMHITMEAIIRELAIA